MFGKNFRDALRAMRMAGTKSAPKIICTLGTTTDDADILREMIGQGMACARINSAYADIADYKRRIYLLRGIANIPVILDLKGSQIRISTDERYRVEVGDEFPVGFQKGSISFNHDFYEEIFPGDLVLFENGTIRTVVAEKKDHYVLLRVIESGEQHLTNHMGVNVPGKIFQSIPLLSSRDLELISFAALENIEYLALSFARTSQDVFNLRKAMEDARTDLDRTQIIVKIEDPTGFRNLEMMIQESKKQGIKLTVMIGRGDLFVEASKYQLALIQKRIIKICNTLGTSVIVGTGLLESMQYSPYPTRAEVCDVSNAILDGADWLMLSAETSNSRYPVEAVKTLADIIQGTRDYLRI